VEFDTVADELYGLAPEEFTRVRNDRAKQARAEKDRALADRITSLRKPTLPAWVTNQLVRSNADEVDLLLELGRELREVLADIEGDELRELTRQRYQLVSALVQQSRSLAQSRGVRVTDDVAQSVRTTLEATLSDEASAEAVSAGRLTEGLNVSGFSTGDAGTGGRPKPSTSEAAAPERPVADLDAERKRRALLQAERAVDAAEKAAQRARIAADRAEQRRKGAERDRTESSAVVGRLRKQLDEATADLDQRRQQEQEAEADTDEAQRRVAEADRALDQARAELDQVSV
jgi:hypothetical protein